MKWNLHQKDIGRTTSCEWYPRHPVVVILQFLVFFIPYLFVGTVSYPGSAKEYLAGEKFWADWHAKYDRYSNWDGKHKLNGISHQAPWNVACLCNYRVINAETEHQALIAFQHHLDNSQPGVLDLKGVYPRWNS